MQDLKETCRAATAPQPVDWNKNDAMERHAPQRLERKAIWQPHSRASRPDLLPWDLGLDWSLPVHERGPELRRLHLLPHVDYTISPTRAEAFTIMEMMGYQVIPHCLCRDIPEGWEAVVIYLTPYGGHGGEGKIKLKSEMARKNYPDKLCSKLVRPDIEGSFAGLSSWHERELVTGDWTMRCRLGSNDWRSNHQAEKLMWTEASKRSETMHAQTHQLCGPHYGVDLVLSGGEWYAIDFNLNPGSSEAPTWRLPGRSIEGAIDAWQGFS